MVDLRSPESRTQLDIIKTAFDEGFYDEEVRTDELITVEDGDPYILAATNHHLYSSLYSDFSFGTLEDSYEDLEVFHEYLDGVFGEYFTKEETNFYLLSDPLLDQYFSLVERTKEILTEKEFQDFRHGSISCLGVAMDYINAVCRDFGCYDHEYFTKDNQFFWILLIEEESDLLLDSSGIWWSHLLLKMVKEKIPLMEEFLENIYK